MSDYLFCVIGEDTLETDIESALHDYEPGVYTLEEYKRTTVKSNSAVECAFDELMDRLKEVFGDNENGELLTKLDFSKLKKEIKDYIDKNLVNWNCEPTGHQFDVVVNEEGDCKEVDNE